MRQRTISIQTLHRLPLYVHYLKALPEACGNISATSIAEGLGLGEVQVRKDLAAVSSGGRPKVGYVTKSLIDDIQNFLGYLSADSAVLVGMGNLGRALTCYGGFSQYGLEIAAAFDLDGSCGEQCGGKKVLPVSRLEELCPRLGARIGIITVPEGRAQEVCDILVRGGVLAIWNFAPVHLTVPEGVLVRNENMAASLAVLSKHLTKKLSKENAAAGGTGREGTAI